MVKNALLLQGPRFCSQTSCQAARQQPITCNSSSRVNQHLWLLWNLHARVCARTPLVGRQEPGASGSKSHCIGDRKTCSASLLFIIQPMTSRPWGGAVHIHVSYSQPPLIHCRNSLTACLEVCLLDEPASHQADSQD